MVFALACLATTTFVRAHLVQIPKVNGLPAPHPLAISADGKTVVGQFAPGNPFTWRGGDIARFRPSSNPNDLVQYAQAISGDGNTIVGKAGSAYIWRRGVGIAKIGDSQSFAYGVSDTGKEVACQVEGRPGIRGFLWTKESTVKFDIFSPTCLSGNGKVVAGLQTDHSTIRAFEFRNQISQELPLPEEYTDSAAYAIDREGKTIVGSVTNNSQTSAAMWRDGKFVKLMDLGYNTAVAKVVTRDGSYIGGYLGNEAAIWSADGKVAYLEMALHGSGTSTNGWKFESVDGIAKVGKTLYVTGWAHFNGKEAGYWASLQMR